MSSLLDPESVSPKPGATVVSRRSVLAQKPLAAALALLFSAQASAATILVDNASDGSVAAACTLRDAVTSANTHASAPASSCVAGDGSNDTLVFAAIVSDIVFATAATGKSSALAVTESLTIDGSALIPGPARNVTIERSAAGGTPNFRLIESSADLTLKNLTISNGHAVAGQNGGAIKISGVSTLTISNSVIAGNQATGTLGGAIYAYDVNLTDSTISGNQLTTASACGGGAITAVGTITLLGSSVVGNTGTCGAVHGGALYAGTTVSLTNSTVSGNVGTSTGSGTIAFGGGIYGKTVNLTNSTVSRNRVTAMGTSARGGGVLTIGGTMTNSTVSGNSSNGIGSGIYARGAVSLYFCTITQNSTTMAGASAGIGLGSSNTSTATASILYGNVGGSDVDGGSFPNTLAGDHNLVGTHGSKVTLMNPTLNCDPKLGPLGNNGGPTATHGLLTGSCAVDAGLTSPTVSTDQRGDLRKVGTASDIGAFEKQGPGDPDLIFADGFDP
jgi:hypothetical protein